MLVPVLELDLPEILRLKLLNVLVSLHDEAESWELARAIADHASLQQTRHRILQQERLKPGERGADPEVDFTPHAHGIG